jgi:hypothetical protein
MTAVATLSTNVRTRQAFWLGVRWGIGHSIGLLLVGIILIAITAPAKNEEEKDGEVVVPHTVETVFESLVGVFMLLLGAYGIHRAVSRRRAQKQQVELEQLQEQELELGEHPETNANLEGGQPYLLSGDDAALLDDPAASKEDGTAAAGVPPAAAHVLLRGTVGSQTLLHLAGEEGSSLLLPTTAEAEAETVADPKRAGSGGATEAVAEGWRWRTGQRPTEAPARPRMRRRSTTKWRRPRAAADACPGVPNASRPESPP